MTEQDRQLIDSYLSTVVGRIESRYRLIEPALIRRIQDRVLSEQPSLRQPVPVQSELDLATERLLDAALGEPSTPYSIPASLPESASSCEAIPESNSGIRSLP